MKEAIAVTSDGFETRHVLRRVDAEFIAAGSGFVVSFDREGEPPGVLGGDGSLRRVEIDEGEPRPLQEGEVLVWQSVRLRQDPDGERQLAVDREALSAHEDPSPDGTSRLVQQPSGRLDALGITPDRSDGAARVLHSSDDGGATRQVTDQVPGVPPGVSGGIFFSSLPSARDDIQAVVQLGEAFGYDVPVGTPSEAVSRSSDGAGWTRFETPVDMGFLGPAVVLPDGRLLAWFGRVPLRPSDPRHGFYVGEDWGALQPVDMGAPFDDVDTFDLVMGES